MTLTPAQALRLFRLGFDTHDIARTYGLWRLALYGGRTFDEPLVMRLIREGLRLERDATEARRA